MNVGRVGWAGALSIATLCACGGGEVSDSERDARSGADGSMGPDAELVSGNAPVLIYDGPREGALIADWDPDLAGGMIVLSQSLATSDWLGSLGAIDAAGAITNTVSDGRVMVWGWPSRFAPGAPRSFFRGRKPIVPDWNPSSPVPVLGLAVSDEIADVFVMYVTVLDDGDSSSVLVPVFEQFIWDSDGPRLLYDGPEAGGGIPGWDADSPRPFVSFSRLNSSSWSSMSVAIADTGMFTGDAERVVVWGW